MSLLRSKKVVVLDVATEACQKVVDYSEAFAEAAEEPPVAELLADLTGQHQQFVTRLDEQVKRFDELPTRPDPDRETLEQALTRMHAALGGDREKILLEKIAAQMEELQQAIQQALDFDLPKATQDLLMDMQQQTGANLERIAAMQRS